ncbi:MAG TPA: ATP-binding protein [Pedobacter sp.]
MEKTLTPYLLGALLDQGYTYALAKIEDSNEESSTEIIRLNPVKKQPALRELPDGFQTFYKLTQEPLQIISGNSDTKVLVSFNNEGGIQVAENDFLDDFYFRYSEDFFEQVLDSIKDYAVFTTNRTGEINSWNTGAERMFNFNRQEILGMNFSVLFSPQDLQNNIPERLLNDAHEHGRADNECFHARKDGSLFWTSGVMVPLYDDRNTHQGFTKVVHDLEKQKLSERKVKEAKALAKNLVETTKEPMAILTKDLSIKLASKNLYRLFQVKEEDAKNKNIYDFAPKLDRDRLKELFETILPVEVSVKNFEFHYTYPSGDNKVFMLHATRTSSLMDGSDITMLSVEDVTEERYIQQEKDDFIGIATHELRGPVTVIKASCQILEREGRGNSSPVFKRYLEKINEQSDKLVHLASLLLDVSRIRTGRFSLKKETFNLCDLLSDTVDDFKILHPYIDIQLTSSSECRVNADKMKLNQVLANLLSNAIKYSPDSKTVQVNVSPDDEYGMAIISVRDFGIGISEEEHGKIFKRFSRTRLVDEKNISGIGLGLYISAEIIRKHEGDIWFESEKNSGSTFYFRIPRF